MKLTIKQIKKLKFINSKTVNKKREAIKHFDLLENPENQKGRHTTVKHILTDRGIIHGETLTPINLPNRKSKFMDRDKVRKAEKYETEMLYKQSEIKTNGLHAAHIVKTVNGDDYGAFWDI